jgi:hypothetical protein
MSNYNGTWAKARRKINEGKNYTDTVAVPIGDGETIDLPHRLLTESELFRVQSSIDQKKLMEHEAEEESDAERRLKELQEKDELTDDEKQELEAVSKEVKRQKVGIMDSMGYDTFKAFMKAGKVAIKPAEEDVSDAFSLGPDEQEDRFGTVPQTREQMRDLLKTEMQNTVSDQPYPIKFTLGQKAYEESLKLIEEGK